MPQHASTEGLQAHIIERNHSHENQGERKNTESRADIVLLDRELAKERVYALATARITPIPFLARVPQSPKTQQMMAVRTH